MKQNKFKIGDLVTILDNGSAVTILIEGKERYGAKAGDKVIIKGIVNYGGNANADDPRYYGDNFNLRGEDLELVNGNVKLKIGGVYMYNEDPHLTKVKILKYTTRLPNRDEDGDFNNVNGFSLYPNRNGFYYCINLNTNYKFIISSDSISANNLARSSNTLIQQFKTFI